ncbi:hypothetical protein, partial [Escherichia coli]|uniref:hypothetical protein n=1 Tax=Escherichia coli TaxID=562 RepID=UPI001BFE52EB
LPKGKTASPDSTAGYPPWRYSALATMIYFWIDPGGLPDRVFATFKLTTSVLRAAVRARESATASARRG